MKSNGRDIIIVSMILVLALIITLTVFKNNKKEAVNMTVAVHVKGEVEKPGYYELSYGNRIKDAIRKAGGATEKANLDDINLAAKLRDGEEIVIPAKEMMSSINGAVTDEYAVNINTADMSLLCTLEGIGMDTAKAIINYRTNCGGFDKIEDLKKVDGIGEAKFKAIKDNIIV